MCQRILIALLILVITGVRATNINCNGKGFYCPNRTHFYVCVDMGGGYTMTMDEVEQECPENTYCDNSSQYECMEIITTTPKSAEASVLTLQWPSSYLSNMGIVPETVQPNPASPIDQIPPVYTPVTQAASPPFESSLYPPAPSTTPPGTAIVKEEYVDNYFKFLPIIKRDTVDTHPGTAASSAGAGYNYNINDVTTILPLNPITSIPISTLLESTASDVVILNADETSENVTIYSKPHSTMKNVSNTLIFTTPNSSSIFDSTTPYIVPTAEYTYGRNSIGPSVLSQNHSITSISPIQDSVTPTRESDSSTPGTLSMTALYPNLSTLESISITEFSNLDSTTPDSEMTTENLINSTTENSLNSTTSSSPSTVQNLFNSTTDRPFNSSTFDLMSSTNLDNSTIKYPTNPTPLDSELTTENIFYSTTEDLTNSTTSESRFFNRTFEKSPISSTFDLTPTTENLSISTTENPLKSTTLDSILLSSTSENLPNSNTLDLISITEYLIISTTENPISSTTLDSILDNLTNENPLILTSFDSIITTLKPLNSTMPGRHSIIQNDNTLNTSTPDSLSTTESSTLHSISPDLTEPSLPPTTELNVTREISLGNLNLTEITTPATGFETTTVKSYIVGSEPKEIEFDILTNGVLFEAPKIVNFTSNILPEVPSTPDHAVSTRMIQTTEMLPFNNRVPGFVPGNIVNTGAYISTSVPPLTIPLAIPNESNAYSGCQRPGQYPDENSCHSYYMCHDNVRYKLICPYNMVYSPSLQKCTTAKDQCSSYNDFACNQVGRFPDTRSCYSYYDCQPNGAGFTVTKVHCPWYSSFQANNGQCVANNNACGCQQTPQTCRYPQQVPVDYQGGQTTSFTFYPDNPITYNREYGVPFGFGSSTNVPVNAQASASTPYLGDRVAIYNRENALPVDPTNTYTDKDYIREKLPVGVNYPYFGDNVLPSVDRAPTYVRDNAPSDLSNGYIKDYTPIVGNTPYVSENVVPVGGTNTYQNIVPADQSNTYYQSNIRGENGYTYNGNVNDAPVDPTNIKYDPSNVGSIDRSSPYVQNNIPPSNFDSGFNYYPSGEATNRLAGTNGNIGDKTRWSQPVTNNEAPGQWTPNYYGSWLN